MKTFFTLLVLGVFLATLSCGGGDDSNGGDNGPTEDGLDTSSTDDTAGNDTGGSNACPGLPDLTGAAFRVTKLIALEPTDAINPTWAHDMDTYDLVIIFYVLEHDIENQKLVLQVTSSTAEKTDNGDGTFTPLSYRFALEPSQGIARLEGCNFIIETPIELNIVTPTVNKPFHCFGIMGSGRLSEDGMKILDATLAGGISEVEAYDLCVEMPGIGTANFHWFMNLASLCANFDSDNNGTLDAYTFSGNLAAVNETELFVPGEIVPVESLVEECQPHEEVCK